MYRNVTIIIILALALVGCSLSSSDSSDGQDVNQDPVLVLDDLDQDPLPTNTPFPTNTPTPAEDDTDTGNSGSGDSGNSGSGNGNSGNGGTVVCTTRTDWPLYTVVAGDTTSRIAQRSGTTTAVLADANCLSDAGVISVGQQLRVPRIPDPDVITRGFISLSGYIALDGDTYTVTANSNQTIRWNNAPSDLSRVDFLLYPPDGLSYTTIGTDINPGNGVSVNWSVAQSTNGFIIARGQNSSGREVAITPQLKIRAQSGTIVDGDIDVSDYVGVDGNTWLVEAGDTVTLRWDEAANYSGISRVEFTFYPQTGAAFSLGTDTDPSNGAAVTWQVPANTIGRISAGGRFANHDVVISTDRFIRSQSGAEVKRGTIAVSPNLGTNSGLLQLETGSTVTVMWNDGPSFAEANAVTFYWGQVGIGGGSWIEIATDNNLGNGLSVQWGVPGPDTQGTIFAESTLTDGTRVISSVDVDFITVVDVSNQEIRGTLTFSPNSGTSDGWVSLEPGTQVTITWASGPTFPEITAATFYTAPTGTGSTGTAIATDSNAADGISITWTVPPNFGGHVYAEADNGQSEFVSQTASVFAEES